MDAEQTVNAEDSQVLNPSVRRQLLKGYLHSLPIPHSRVVRIFVSSSYSGNIYTFSLLVCSLSPKVEEALSDAGNWDPSVRLSVHHIPRGKIGAF